MLVVVANIPIQGNNFSFSDTEMFIKSMSLLPFLEKLKIELILQLYLISAVTQ